MKARSPAEVRTLNFYAWEKRSRGWELSDRPVDLEPPYTPPFLPEQGSFSVNDDGRKHTWVSYLVDFLSGSLKRKASSNQREEPKPTRYQGYQTSEPIAELALIFPSNLKVNLPETEQFLLMIADSQFPLSFEIIILPDTIIFQFAGSRVAIERVKYQLGAYFPDVVVQEREGYLKQLWNPQRETAIVDLGLSEEFMLPLHTPSRLQPDPFIGIIGAAEYISSNLHDGEMGMIQVLFQTTQMPWAKSIMHAVSDGSGGCFFADAPEMLPLAREKVASPIFSVVLRCVGKSYIQKNARVIVETLYDSLQVLNRTGSNALIPLSNEGYSLKAHSNNVLLRQSNRTGMLLNSRELITLVHLPGADVVSPKLQRSAKKTKPAPPSVLHHPYVLGKNIHQGIEQVVSYSDKQKTSHSHIIGITGMGKSTLIQNMTIQDTQLGNGFALFDPHGDLVDSLLRHIPKNRQKDVIVIDPADTDHPIGINLLEAHSEAEKIVLSSDIVDMFIRLATSWGDKMTVVLSNGVDASLESTQVRTLIDLRRFLVEKAFRERFLETVTDPAVVYYWKHEFPLLKGGSIAPLLTRLNTFLRPKIIRNMVGQKKGLDFHNILKTRKILLVKLAQGLIGESNSYLLGSLIVAKIHQAAQQRQSMDKKERTPFYLYIDEFQNFMTPSMESILSGARKYGLGLVLAHQDLQQLFKQNAELGNSVISNPGTRICFRVGDFDAKKLENGFSFFGAEDLQNLGIGEAIARVGQRDHDFNLTTNLPEAVPDDLAEERRLAILKHSREKYSSPREEVEAELAEQFKVSTPSTQKSTPPKFSPKAQPVTPPEKASEEKNGEKKQPAKDQQQSVPNTETIQEASQQFLKKEKEKKEQSEHRYLQTLIKRMAESLGYLATIEAPTPDNSGRVDVSLEQGKKKIACEISVTNTKEYEVQNIQKCLSAGYDQVIVCSKNGKHLASIQQLAQKSLTKKVLKQVFFMEPDALSQYLISQAAQSASTEKRVKGYRVKVNYAAVDAKNAKQKQQKITDVVVKAMRDRKE